MNKDLLEKHIPYRHYGILGCDGYDNVDTVICMTASADNNFRQEGIVEGSLLFIDTAGAYEKGRLNVFRYHTERSPQYKLSRRKIPKGTFVGKVVMAVNQY